MTAPVSETGSRGGFCVLFCGRKEGTIIANDSHLRGDTMLNIYFDVFSDIVNVLLFNGKQVLGADSRSRI